MVSLRGLRRSLIACCAALTFVHPAQAQGRLVVDTLHSVALRDNAIGDPPDRAVTIYLPPSYARDTTRRYPVAYLLHGVTSDPREWLDGTYQGLDLAALLDQRAPHAEYLVVMPHANNRYGGSFYVNSHAFGRWEDAMANELVVFVDARYRTLPVRQSRALVGQSMGGFGALYLAGRHANVFAHVYAMSPCCLGFVGDLAPDGARWRTEPRGWLRTMAMAFTPDRAEVTGETRLPFAVQSDGRAQEVGAVARAWREVMPLYRLEQEAAPYAHLCSMALEAGQQDEIPNVPAGAAAFSQQLTRLGIGHTFDAFTGGHIDHTRERFERAVLPFLERVLATTQQRGACG